LKGALQASERRRIPAAFVVSAIECSVEGEVRSFPLNVAKAKFKMFEAQPVYPFRMEFETDRLYAA